MEQRFESRGALCAHAFVKGEADIMDIAPEWDRELMEILASGDLSPLDGWAPDWMEQVAGHSAHEVRTWIAALFAGDQPLTTVIYEPVTEWITGMGIAASAELLAT